MTSESGAKLGTVLIVVCLLILVILLASAHGLSSGIIRLGF